MKKARVVVCLECNKESTTLSPNFKRCPDCRELYNKNFMKDYRKEWYERKSKQDGFLESRAEYSRENRREYPEKRLLLGAKQRAKDLSLEFNIDLEDIRIPELCPILKVPMKVGSRYAPSLDRIVPDLGYTKGNVWVISRKANVMKNDASLEELKEFSNWVNTLVVS